MEDDHRATRSFENLSLQETRSISNRLSRNPLINNRLACVKACVKKRNVYTEVCRILRPLPKEDDVGRLRRIEDIYEVVYVLADITYHVPAVSVYEANKCEFRCGTYIQREIEMRMKRRIGDVLDDLDSITDAFAGALVSFAPNARVTSALGYARYISAEQLAHHLLYGKENVKTAS